MSITIKQFKVTDTLTGKVKQSGRRTSSYLETIVSMKTFSNNLAERNIVQGTPSTITKEGLSNNAHMSTKYIKIDRLNIDNNITDHLYVSTKLRITKISGQSSAQNMICYGWVSSLTTTSTNVTWNVLFANFNSHTDGDYIDVELPNSTHYPNLYLALILINDAWRNKTITNETLKICSIQSNLDYFSIDPDKSNADISDSHMIIIQASNSKYGLHNRICIAFEDWYMNKCDKDYNDVVISLQDAQLDQNNINDVSLS